MRFTIATVAALLSTGVIAAPAPQANAGLTETVVINDFSARHQTSGAVDSVGLHITSVTSDDADNLECSKTGEVVLGEKYPCGDSKYSFALVKGASETWAVRLFHRWGVASGSSGSRDVPTYCHGGPLGSTLCTAQGPVSIYLDASPKDY
ncbi:protein elicitor protein [Colletotrichum plurivorum]|uniref:Protein elicitor protein n=1 Tax=Colletotrichum plurivorum TaxID=2175906 RepID=A0A8H6NIF6_9PEZI|nr:protein elicitor protein [Colletotrichum plurivorum]